jgi:hypothetical protein
MQKTYYETKAEGKISILKLMIFLSLSLSLSLCVAIIAKYYRPTLKIVMPTIPFFAAAVSSAVSLSPSSGPLPLIISIFLSFHSDALAVPSRTVPRGARGEEL